MVAGVLVAASLVCVGSAVLRHHSRVAAVLFAAALAASAADEFGAGQAFHDVAVGLAFAGALAMVLERLGRPLTMSWLDAAMGACAVGALAVTTGAELPATLAAVGVAATLGLARWRVTIALGLRARRARRAGRAAAARGRRSSSPRCSPRAGGRRPPRTSARSSSPRSSPTPATALTLLVVGQFVSLPPVAATLATVTVLTGMARAGLTIVDRLRATRARRGHRRPDRPRQPPPPAATGWPRRSRTRRATSPCC